MDSFIENYWLLKLVTPISRLYTPALTTQITAQLTRTINQSIRTTELCYKYHAVIVLSYWLYCSHVVKNANSHQEQWVNNNDVKVFR